ncbi:MAG: hypothetical protein K2K83_05355, partial [Rikenella sp.]|nr:hypothetical protein [Rikenella sp.]
MKKLFLIACGMLFLVSCTKTDRSFEADSVSALKVQFSEAEMQRLPLLSDNHRRTPETVLTFAKEFVQTIRPDSKANFESFSISDSVSLGNDILTKGEDLNVVPLYVVSRGTGQG